jgi:hypothetical protein
MWRSQRLQLLTVYECAVIFQTPMIPAFRDAFEGIIWLTPLKEACVWAHHFEILDVQDFNSPVVFERIQNEVDFFWPGI